MNQTTMFDLTAPAQYDDMPLAQPIGLSAGEYSPLHPSPEQFPFFSPPHLPLRDSA